MTDKPWQRDEPQSPCQNICVIHPDAKICIGCYRTIDEISAWSQLGKDARIALIEALLTALGSSKPAAKAGAAAKCDGSAVNVPIKAQMKTVQTQHLKAQILVNHLKFNHNFAKFAKK